ncbi:MAG: hypothetical protein OEV59_09755 [Deltaproteobacteria bacterium]|nr:hypothetical protein [Deltaproteobacteria bacterium]
MPGSAAADNKATLYFFYGEGCPHCAKEEVFLEKMKAKYPSIDVRAFEVWHNPENVAIMTEFLAPYGLKPTGVPVTFIGNSGPLSGYGDDSTSGRVIEGFIKDCVESGCPDAGDIIRGTAKAGASKAKLPTVAGLDVNTASLPILTIVIAFLDGFNPCAFFVLFTLLGILSHAKTRGRMLFAGALFVFVSGLAYFLFMAAWLNVFIYTGGIRVVTLVAALLALVIGAFNIKDFFMFGRGPSLSIPEGAKPGLYARMRTVMRAASLASVITGTIMLAVSVNLYELLCTAGFPMVYTRALTLRSLEPHVYYIYLAAYNVVYVIPMAAIVALFAFTVGSRHFSERWGRTLKFVSGLMMLSLGLVLLIKPELLNNVMLSAALLGLAVGAAFVAAYFTREKGTSS